MSSTIIPFGKYNGKTFEQVAEVDPGYMVWMAGEHIVRSGVNFSQLAEQFLETHNLFDEEEEEEWPDVCPVCYKPSCSGPAEHRSAQDMEDARYAAKLALSIRQDARVFERKRNLTAEEVLARVPEADKERYLRGKALSQAGAYRP